MFCKKCGSLINDDSTFCQLCGEKVIDNNESSDLAKTSHEENHEIDSTVENIKKGFATFAGIAGNVVKGTTNYLKEASEKYVQNSQSTLTNKQSNDKNVYSEQVTDIDELKKKLNKLKEMYDEGLLTNDEYVEKRNAIMGKQYKNEIASDKVLDTTKCKTKVKKCPSCGELLGAFDVKCPSCGYEIRDIENSNAIKEFQKGLYNTENQGNEFNAFGLKLKWNDKKSKDKKIEYIKNYVVPRTKEDLIEFMVLAKSNVEPRLYQKKGLFDRLHGCKNDDDYEDRKSLSDAWLSMMQQIFEKAKVMFDEEDKTYKKIEKMYIDIYNQINIDRRK